ncbi:MAG: hypothetical protein ACXWAC_13265 [Usitatibacter sp.]
MLKRYSISQSRVSLAREGSLEVATVRGTLSDARRSIGLAAALSRIPGVLEAVVSRDDDSLAAFYCAPPRSSKPAQGRSNVPFARSALQASPGGVWKAAQEDV